VVFDAIRENVATKVDIAAARVEVEKARIALNTRIDLVERRLMTRLGGMMVVLAGLLFAALHYWPSHG
jgi:hypothetical protein